MLQPSSRKAKKETESQYQNRTRLINNLIFEVIPLKSLDAALDALPSGSTVSVTASPVKGQDATCRIAEQVMEAGHSAIPHMSARLVPERSRTAELAAWMRSTGVKTIFVVGGDAETPGDYFDAPEFLRDLLECDHGLETIGVTAYPHGHPLISNDLLHKALHAKQRMIASAGLKSYCSTQMCFDPKLIINWLREERATGLEMPVHLGIAGVVDRAKLLSMGVRLGIGSSLRYLRKNRAAITKLMTTTKYDPDNLLVPLSPYLSELNVSNLHVFTFNQVATTVEWQNKHSCQQA